jgi:hypothetical protein
MRVHHKPCEQFGPVEGVKACGYRNADQNKGNVQWQGVENSVSAMLANLVQKVRASDEG